MKINLNLAVYQPTHERYALGWTVPVACGALVTLVYLGGSALRTIRAYQKVHRSVAECQAQMGLLRDRQQAAVRRLQQPQFQGVLREAGYVNSLIDRRQLSVTELIAKLNRLMPADVRLTTLSLSEGSEGPLVRMTIEGSHQEKVIAFVQNLEESSDFSDPAITSEDPGSQGGGAPGPQGGAPSEASARVICTALYSGWQDGNKSEVRNQKPEARSQKQEAGSKKPEARSKKPEAGSQKSAVRSQGQKSEASKEK
jgi:hypothetical protein